MIDDDDDDEFITHMQGYDGNYLCVESFLQSMAHGRNIRSTSEVRLVPRMGGNGETFSRMGVWTFGAWAIHEPYCFHPERGYRVNNRDRYKSW